MDEGVGSASEGNLVVGFWKGIERKRTDSILAVGTNDKIWRLNCLIKGYRCEQGLQPVYLRQRCITLTHLGGHDLGRYISDKYRPRVPLIRSLVRRYVFSVLS